MRHLAVLALALSFVGCADEGKQSKVTMCHNTSSATNPVVMITVANASQRAHHENHGDYEAATWYADMDGDGLGDASDSVVDCEEPSGYVDNPDDDDDNDDGGDDPETGGCEPPAIELPDGTCFDPNDAGE